MKRRPLTSNLSRRAVVKGGLLSTAAFSGLGNIREFSRKALKKPIKIGLTCDASGQYGASGQDDLLGMRMAIDEANAKGGVLGRKIEWITADTETNPATGTASPSDLSPRRNAASYRCGAFRRRQRHHAGRQ